MKNSVFEENYIKTIESLRYESTGDGKCRCIGMRTPYEIFSELKNVLKERNLIPDEYFMLDYEDEEPDFWKTVEGVTYNCSVNFGNCEGICISIKILMRCKNENIEKNMISGKTLSDNASAFRHMGKIATMCSLLLNGYGNNIRDGYKINIVYPNPYSDVPMTAKELIYALGFDSDKYIDKISEVEMLERISGVLCNCDKNEGEFELLPVNHEDVISGEKRYMVCRKCGGFSHL